MATAGDGRAPYDGTGAGGKFRKRPFRRSAPATPYDRPPIALRNNNPSLFTKLVDPASRLIYAGAHRLFGAFRKRLPSLLSQGPPEINEEPQNIPQEAGPINHTGVSELNNDQVGNSASIAAATGISELEQMLKQKTFSRSEIEHLTALLHSRTTESPSGGSKPPGTPSSLLRLEASTSGTLRKYGDERDNLHAAVSTPVISSRVLEEEIASPAELAKAYMGSRPTKVAPLALGLSSQSPRKDLILRNNDSSTIPKTPFTSLVPKTANSFRGLENGFTTPRSRGRSAMYNMARTPYSRPPSTFGQKGIKSDYGHAAALTSPQSAWGHEGSNKLALKRRSSVLEDDIGSGGPLRRTRQKANLVSQASYLSRDKRQLGYTSFEQSESASQKLLLTNEPEPKASKRVTENGETSMRGSGYGSVPTKSTQMATKILQQLERLSPKEKASGTPTKLTSNMLHGQALRSMEKVESPKFLPSPQESQKSEGQGQHHARSNDAHGSTSQSQSKEKLEETGPRKFPIPRNLMTPVNGDTAGPSKSSAPIVIATDSKLKLPAEPPQKKRAFQMSAHEDSFELDDDIIPNGHTPVPLVESKKPETPLVATQPLSADVIQTPTPPEASKPPAPAEVSPVSPEVAKIPAKPDLKETSDAKSPPKPEQNIGFKFSTSPPSSAATQTVVVPQLTSQTDKVSPQKDTNAFPSFGKTPEKASPFQSAASNEPSEFKPKVFPSFVKTPEKASPLNEPSEFKPNASSDSKPAISTSLFSSVTKNEQVKFPVFNKNNEPNDGKSTNILEKSESLSPAPPTPASTTGIFSFGISTKNSTTTTTTPTSNPPIFSSTPPFPSFTTNQNSLLNNKNNNNNNSNFTPSTTAAASTVLPSSAPPPVFSFGSSITPSTAPTTSVVEATNEKEPNPNPTTTTSPFPSTSFPATTTAGSSLFGFSSPATTSTTNTTQSQPSFFNAASASQATTQAAAPFLFGSSTSSSATTSATGGSFFSATSGSPATTSATGGSFFNATSAPATTSVTGGSFFNAASGSVATTQTVSFQFNSSTSASGGSLFGSSTPSFGITSETKPSGPTSNMFGSAFGSTPSVFSFGASSTPAPTATTAPVMFGSSNPSPSTGFSFNTTAPSVFGNSTPVFGNSPNNNNDQMSMEDSMTEDFMQSPSPVSAFGQTPGFQFGSATPTQNPTPTPTPAVAQFQFGGQANPVTAQNPFQASGSVEFNAGGGSFSLGSGDKSGRKFVRVKPKNRRK